MAKEPATDRPDLHVEPDEDGTDLDIHLAAFGDRLRPLVDRFGGARAFAAECGVPRSAVDKWLGGRAGPGFRSLVAIKRVTGASLDQLVAGESVESAVDLTLLERIVVAIEEEIMKKGWRPSPEDRAQWLVLRYKLEISKLGDGG